MIILIYFYLGDHDQGGVLQPLAEERDQHPVGDRRANGEEDRHVGVLGRDAKSAFIIFTNFVFFLAFLCDFPLGKKYACCYVGVLSRDAKSGNHNNHTIVLVLDLTSFANRSGRF